MSSTQELFIVSIPNYGKKSESVFSSLQSIIREKSLCKVHRFDIPALNVGTLDSLMAISDDLIKLNTQVENVVRKVERQHNEITNNDTSSLRINDMPIEGYLRNFQWDFARYRFQGRPLTDIIGQVQGVAAKVDEELKKLSQSFMEKQQNLSSLQRKKSANMITADFEDFLTPAEAKNIEILDSELLSTLIVAVPQALENDFLKIYDKIGDSIANYGGPEVSDVGSNDGKFGSALRATRAASKGSPVAPGSAIKIKAEGDVVLYSVVALKGQHEAGGIDEGTGDVVEGRYISYIEPLKTAFRDKRFVVRDFSYDPEKAGNLDNSIEKLRLEVQHANTTLVRWCKAHFGELYAGWIHLKVIRSFVESVLRYGLPVDFLSVIVEPSMKHEKAAFSSMLKAINRITPELRMKSGGVMKTQSDFDTIKIVELAESEEEEDIDAENVEHLPFVCQSFNVIGSGPFK